MAHQIFLLISTTFLLLIAKRSVCQSEAQFLQNCYQKYLGNATFSAQINKECQLRETSLKYSEVDALPQYSDSAMTEKVSYYEEWYKSLICPFIMLRDICSEQPLIVSALMEAANKENICDKEKNSWTLFQNTRVCSSEDRNGASSLDVPTENLWHTLVCHTTDIRAAVNEVRTCTHSMLTKIEQGQNTLLPVCCFFAPNTTGRMCGTGNLCRFLTRFGVDCKKEFESLGLEVCTDEAEIKLFKKEHEEDMIIVEEKKRTETEGIKDDVQQTFEASERTQPELDDRDYEDLYDTKPDEDNNSFET